MNLDQLIAQPEGNTLDFKRDLSSLQRVVKTIAAISNTANGTVVIGVADDKTVVGLKEPLKDEERLSRAVADSIEPLLLVNIQHASREDASVLVVDVPFSPRPYYLSADGPKAGVYVREGSTNTQADPATIAELRRQAASQSFDLEAIPAVSSDDLDPTRLKAAFSGRSVVQQATNAWHRLPVQRAPGCHSRGCHPVRHRRAASRACPRRTDAMRCLPRDQ